MRYLFIVSPAHVCLITNVHCICRLTNMIMCRILQLVITLCQKYTDIPALLEQ